MANDTLARPACAADDWTVPQEWDRYGADEHAMWDRLFERQARLLPGRVAPAFIEGLDVLRLSKPGIPDFAELNARLMDATGWQVVAVPGLVPDDVFFDHLANRRFVAGRFIRKPDQIDYLEEPDIFHDVFGHVPCSPIRSLPIIWRPMGAAGSAPPGWAPSRGWRGSIGTRSSSA
jgi:phenylalanine-4-hydroxylase